MKYYAATMRGESPFGIDQVFSFEKKSMRTQWLSETRFPKQLRISITAKIAKKHQMLPVTFRTAERMGQTVWVWFYNEIPDWLAYQN